MNIIYIYVYIYIQKHKPTSERIRLSTCIQKKTRGPIYSQRTQRDTLWDLQFQGLLFFVQRLSLKNQPWDGWSLQPMWMKDRQTGTSCGGWLVALDSQKLQLQTVLCTIILPPKKGRLFPEETWQPGEGGPLRFPASRKEQKLPWQEGRPHGHVQKSWTKTGEKLGSA